jgi:riboflavin kinase / FMN adenylyltransferase
LSWFLTRLVDPKPGPRLFVSRQANRRYRLAVLTHLRLEDLIELEVPVHLALGVFDGVHLGHQEVILRALDASRRHGGMGGVLTFEPHPIQVIAPERAPTALLATLDHKARLVRAMGAELFIPLRFDRSLAAMEATEFLDRLLAGPVRTIAVGEDWRFGRERRGDVDLLRQQAVRRGFELIAVPPVMYEGERISSTRVRQALRDGNLAAAAGMLGRDYTIAGRVVEGKKLGRELGFPTANVDFGNIQLPPDGVWAVRAGLPDGSEVPGVANLGVRPTVDGRERVLEAHLLGFSGDLYGQELEIRFQGFLRAERKMPSLQALREQISLDCAAAAEFFGISNASA